MSAKKEHKASSESASTSTSTSTSTGEPTPAVVDAPAASPEFGRAHVLRHAGTGEEKFATEAEWATNGEALRADGWTRVDPDPPAEVS